MVSCSRARVEPSLPPEARAGRADADLKLSALRMFYINYMSASCGVKRAKK